MAPNTNNPNPELRPHLLEDFMSGATVAAYEGHALDQPPPWLDHAKCKRGKQFAQKHLLPILIGHFFSMMCIFVWPPIFQVVLYTQNLDSIKKAARRNFGNLVYFRAWYHGDFSDPSDQAHHYMKRVQMMHRVAGSSSNGNPDKVKMAAADMDLEPEIRDLCKTWTVIQRDMMSGLYSLDVLPLKVPPKLCYVSQVDHIITVLGLITPLLVSTEAIGIHGATDEDLEGFVHLWRVIGYHLGIKDRYNPCEGSVANVRARCQDLIGGVVFPSLQDMSKQKEYIMRVSIDSLFQKALMTSFLTFDVITMFMMWALKLPVPTFYKEMPLKSRVSYWILRFISGYVLKMPLVLRFLNYLLGLQVARLTKKTKKG